MSHAATPIRIVLADDHPLVRDGLRRLFELQAEFTVVGEAADGLEALQAANLETVHHETLAEASPGA